MGATVDELIPIVGARRACQLTGRSRASHYRNARGPLHGPPAPRAAPANKLTDEEADALWGVMSSPEFVDLAPAQIWAMGVPALFVRRRDGLGDSVDLISTRSRGACASRSRMGRQPGKEL